MRALLIHSVIGFLAFLCIGARSLDGNAIVWNQSWAGNAVNKTVRPSIIPDITVVESTEYCCFISTYSNWNRCDKPALCIGAYIIKPFPLLFVLDYIWNIFRITESPFYIIKMSGCASVVVDMNIKIASYVTGNINRIVTANYCVRRMIGGYCSIISSLVYGLNYLSNTTARYIWPLKLSNKISIFLANISKTFGSRDQCNGVGFLTNSNLVHFYNSPTQKVGLQPKDNELENTDRYQRSGENGEPIIGSPTPPFGRRFIIALFGAVVGVPFYFYGILNLNDKRRLICASLIICGFLWFSGGLILLWLTGFRATWSWWL